MKRVLGGLLLLLTVGMAHAQTLRPTVALVNPSGGQRGTTVTITLTGINLGYGTQLIIMQLTPLWKTPFLHSFSKQQSFLPAEAS